MKVTIRKKNLNITPALAEYIEKKILKPIKKLLKDALMNDFSILDLEIARATRHHRKGKVYRAEANLSLGKKVFHAEADNENIRAACDIIEKELEQEVVSERGRIRARNLRALRKVKKDLRFDPLARMNRKGRIRNEGN